MLFGRMHKYSAAGGRVTTGGYRCPPGARGVKFLLAERNADRTYAVLEPVSQLRVPTGRAASQLRAQAAMAAGSQVFRKSYWAEG